jgi:hypothetical protein
MNTWPVPSGLTHTRSGATKYLPRNELKSWLLVVLSCLSLSAFASDATWIKIDDKVFLDRHYLQLNGAGLRTKSSSDVYIAALYLKEKKMTEDAVFSDSGEKRIALHVLTVISTGQMLGAFDEAIAANHSATELADMTTPLAEFGEILRNMNQVKRGDVIALDYLPGRGTWISLNGALRGTIAGTSFYKSLLKIWLGDHPVQEDLKYKLLGQQ